MLRLFVQQRLNLLRHLVTDRESREKSGHSLQATALVHEAYLRLVGDVDPEWNGRGHFFAAAAEAMRRILVEISRRKRALKRVRLYQLRKRGEPTL